MFFVPCSLGRAGGIRGPWQHRGGIGLVLLFQNITGHWESMSYFWTLIFMSVGVGIYLMGWYGEDANQKKTGAGLMKAGFILFIIFGAFFEMIFSSFGNLIFPLLSVGCIPCLSRSGLSGNGRTNDTPCHSKLITESKKTRRTLRSLWLKENERRKSWNRNDLYSVRYC
jgi:hypothetical protein